MRSLAQCDLLARPTEKGRLKVLNYIFNNIWLFISIFGIATLAFLYLIFNVFPRVVRQLPETYFVDDDLERDRKNLLRYIGRNLIGVLLLIAGPIVMLPLITLPPGSGLVVMVMGLGMMDFPGKRRQLRRILRSAKVRRLLNWMRTSSGTRPFIMPDDLEQNSSHPANSDQKNPEEASQPQSKVSDKSLPT